MTEKASSELTRSVFFPKIVTAVNCRHPNYRPRNHRHPAYRPRKCRHCRKVILPCVKKIYFLQMPLFFHVTTQTMPNKSIIHSSIAMISVKNLVPWRDLNPRLLFLGHVHVNCNTLPGHSHITFQIFRHSIAPIWWR
jgi:hypothetical protein